MRILYHHRTRAEDAQGIHIEEMIRAFRELGHQVVESALVPRSTAAAAPPAPGVVRMLSNATRGIPGSVYEPLEIGYNAVGYGRVSRGIASFAPDLVYERYALNTGGCVLATLRHRVPHVLEVNAPLAVERAAHGGLAFPALARRIEAWVWRSTGAIVAVSTPLAEMVTEAGVPRERVFVMPNGVRRELLEHRGNGASVRARYGIPADRVVVGFAGWFRAWHGLETLIEAFAAAGMHRNGGHLLLVGDGDVAGALRARAARAGVEGRLTITGAVGRDAIAEHVAAFDIAVQPHATPYASPMKIFEYLALGRPIVAAATPAIREVLTDESDALLFPAGDRDALAARLAALVEDPARRRALGAAARETVVRRGFLWSENARRVCEIAQSLRPGQSASS